MAGGPSTAGPEAANSQFADMARLSKDDAAFIRSSLPDLDGERDLRKACHTLDRLQGSLPSIGDEQFVTSLLSNSPAAMEAAQHLRLQHPRLQVP